MSDDDDYLSDKFLAAASAPSVEPKAYSSLRKEAQKRSQRRNEENRTKSRHQREVESRKAGLSKSLFERVQDDQAAGLTSGSKALSIMMKMGFKPGQSLGRADVGEPAESSATPTATAFNELAGTNARDSIPRSDDDSHQDVESDKPRHIAEPLPLNEWAGRKGIGTLKRARSPSSAERVAKMAKMEEANAHADFRDRARRQYEERRAEGTLTLAQRTCVTLDEKSGKEFNILWLDPSNPASFPEGFVDALSLHTTYAIAQQQSDRRYEHETPESRMRRQMRADALQPLHSVLDESEASDSKQTSSYDYSMDDLQDAAQFLRLEATDRLELVLSYLRKRYTYCYWCGTQYPSIEEMDEQCPGLDEELHD